MDLKSKFSKQLKDKYILVKAGGNALTDRDVKTEIIRQLALLYKHGAIPILVHGGGIAIQDLLEKANVTSEFIAGHRKTDSEVLIYAEMALSGQVNKELVRLLNQQDVKAVGISGKDAGFVRAKKRLHTEIENGKSVQSDLGQVGDVFDIDTSLIETLVSGGFMPVVSPVSTGVDGLDYNINADMFAGHLAGALHAEYFFALTNVDGLLKDINQPDSLIRHLTPSEVKNDYSTIVKGGMIPKIEACCIAVEQGVRSAHILNGTKKNTLIDCLQDPDSSGTTIKNL